MPRCRPLGRPKEFDRDVVLERAIKAFASHGYEGASTAALLTRMGISRQSLYDTFGDKRRLYLEALGRYSRRSTRRDHRRSWNARGLEAALLAFAARAARDEGRLPWRRRRLRVRPARTAEVTSATQTAPRASLLAAFEALVAGEQGGGRMAADLDPNAAAQFLSSTLAGLKVSARGRASPERSPKHRPPGAARSPGLARPGLSASHSARSILDQSVCNFSGGFKMSKTLEGKIALVTGGSRGIGAAIVRRLGRATALPSPSPIRPRQERAAALAAEVAAGRRNGPGPIAADSADPEAVKAAVAASCRAVRPDRHPGQQRRHILLRGVVDEFSLEDFDRMFAVNVRAVFVGVQAVLPHMGDGGRIVTTGSVVADRSGFPAGRSIALTKAAVAAMTPRVGARSGAARDHRQRRPARPHRDGYEPRRGAQLASRADAAHRPHGQGLRGRQPGRLSGPGRRRAFVNGSALTIDGGFLA